MLFRMDRTQTCHLGTLHAGVFYRLKDDATKKDREEVDLMISRKFAAKATEKDLEEAKAKAAAIGTKAKAAPTIDDLKAKVAEAQAAVDAAEKAEAEQKAADEKAAAEKAAAAKGK